MCALPLSMGQLVRAVRSLPLSIASFLADTNPNLNPPHIVLFLHSISGSTTPRTCTITPHTGPLLERYQGIKLSDITFKRALFGLFPTYRDSPLRPGFDRVLQVWWWYDAEDVLDQVHVDGLDAPVVFSCLL